MHITGNRVTIEAHHVLAPGRERHKLAYTVCDKFQPILQQCRFVFLHFVKSGFDEDENRVVTPNLHILELVTPHAIHVEMEMPFRSQSCHLDGRNVDLLLAAVIDHHLLGCRSLKRDHRIECYRVLVKSQLITRRCRESVFNTRRERHHCQASDNSNPQ